MKQYNNSLNAGFVFNLVVKYFFRHRKLTLTLYHLLGMKNGGLYQGRRSLIQSSTEYNLYSLIQPLVRNRDGIVELVMLIV
jgi:hypothetical protein